MWPLAMPPVGRSDVTRGTTHAPVLRRSILAAAHCTALINKPVRGHVHRRLGDVSYRGPEIWSVPIPHIPCLHPLSVPPFLSSLTSVEIQLGNLGNAQSTAPARKDKTVLCVCRVWCAGVNWMIVMNVFRLRIICRRLS